MVGQEGKGFRHIPSGTTLRSNFRFGSLAEVICSAGHVRSTPKADVPAYQAKVTFGPIPDQEGPANQ
jgi:hypothetical protein